MTMPVPSVITDLSTTAISNSPAGTDSPSQLDDIQRAHGSFIAQLRTGAVATTANVTSGTITGATINNTSVGATTPSTGSFTTLNSTGGALNGTVGATTPSTGAFTTLSASSTITGTQGTAYGFIVPNSGAVRSPSNGVLYISADTANAYASSAISFDIDGTIKATLDTTGLAITGTLSSTGNTTLGDASTDTVTVNGNLGVGGVSGSGTGVWVRNSALTGTTQRGVYGNVTGTSAATTAINAIEALPATEAVAFTVANLSGFIAQNATKGAGSNITSQHGLYIADQTQGANNYGITSAVSSGANKWNIYASGTADNYFAGNVGVGTSAPSTRLHLKNADDGTDLTIRLDHGDTSLTTDQQIGAVEVYSNDPSGAGVGVKGALRIRSSDATGTQSYLTLSTSSTTVNDVERMRIDSTGNVGLGVTPSGWGGSYKALQFGQLASINAISTVTALGNNYYHNGTSPVRISAQEASVYSQNAGFHTWYTAPTGTAGSTFSWTQSLSVGNGTTLALEGATSAAGTGIAFPATQVASSNANTLDDYEEGTFTPTIVGTTTAGTGTYTTQVGRYTKVGNRVMFQMRIVWTAHTGTGNMFISGLPFTSASGTNNTHVASLILENAPFTGQVTGYIAAAGSSVGIGNFASNGAMSDVALDAVAAVWVSGQYEAA